MHLRFVVPLPASPDERERLFNGAKTVIEPPHPAQSAGNKGETTVADVFGAGCLQRRHMVSHSSDAVVEIARHSIRPSEVNFAEGAAGEKARFGRQCQSCFSSRSHLLRFAAELMNVGGESVDVREDIFRGLGSL